MFYWNYDQYRTTFLNYINANIKYKQNKEKYKDQFLEDAVPSIKAKQT